MARKIKNVIILYALLFIFLICNIEKTIAADLHIAVASNFKHTLQAIVEKIQNGTDLENIEIIISSGSSGVLYAQIHKGAPYDIFLSADQARPSELIAGKLALGSSELIYARGQLVLWQVDAQKVTNLSSLYEYRGRYTLANPKHAPYGQAAKVLMQKSNLWSALDSKRVTAQNIAGAFQYLASGTIKLGWVAYSQLKQWQKNHTINTQSYWLPHLDDYPAIQQVAVILSRTKNRALAKVFMEKLSAPEVVSLIKLHGYLVENNH